MSDVWRRQRNAYARLLLLAVRERDLSRAPFDRGPPDAQLGQLPPHLVLHALGVCRPISLAPPHQSASNMAWRDIFRRCSAMTCAAPVVLRRNGHPEHHATAAALANTTQSGALRQYGGCRCGADRRSTAYASDCKLNDARGGEVSCEHKGSRLFECNCRRVSTLGGEPGSPLFAAQVRCCDCLRQARQRSTASTTTAEPLQSHKPPLTRDVAQAPMSLRSSTSRRASALGPARRADGEHSGCAETSAAVNAVGDVRRPSSGCADGDGAQHLNKKVESSSVMSHAHLAQGGVTSEISAQPIVPSNTLLGDAGPKLGNISDIMSSGASLTHLKTRSRAQVDSQTTRRSTAASSTLGSRASTAVAALSDARARSDVQHMMISRTDTPSRADRAPSAQSNHQSHRTVLTDQGGTRTQRAINEPSVTSTHLRGANLSTSTLRSADPLAMDGAVAAYMARQLLEQVVYLRSRIAELRVLRKEARARADSFLPEDVLPMGQPTTAAVTDGFPTRSSHRRRSDEFASAVDASSAAAVSGQGSSVVTEPQRSTGRGSSVVTEPRRSTGRDSSEKTAPQRLTPIRDHVESLAASALEARVASFVVPSRCARDARLLQHAPSTASTAASIAQPPMQDIPPHASNALPHHKTGLISVTPTRRSVRERNSTHANDPNMTTTTFMLSPETPGWDGPTVRAALSTSITSEDVDSTIGTWRGQLEAAGL